MHQGDSNQNTLILRIFAKYWPAFIRIIMYIAYVFVLRGYIHLNRRLKILGIFISKNNYLIRLQLSFIPKYIYYHTSAY